MHVVVPWASRLPVASRSEPSAVASRRPRWITRPSAITSPVSGRHLPRKLAPEELDPAPLLWDMRRRVRHGALPPHPLVVRFELTEGRARRFLLLRRTEASLCTEDPGFPEEVVVHSPTSALAAWWRGDVDYARARRSGLAVEGAREHVRAFPDWFERYALAGVAPA